MSLAGKTAVVTGGSRGIGRAICLRLAQMGARVVINYVSRPEAAEETRAQVAALGGECSLFQFDVADYAGVQEAFQQIATECGSLDILVCNAGITRDNLLMKMKEEDWDQVMAVNLKGAFNCIKAVSKIMVKQRSGRIINLASVVGVMGNPGQANYVASKAGMIGLTKTVAKELGARGITVNAVAPGFIETDMTAVLSDKVKEAMLGMVPLQRAGTPQDVADAITFLASDQAAYITGQVIHVTGGMYM